MESESLEKRMAQVISETGMSRTDLIDLIKEVKNKFKGLLSDKGALFLIGRELGVDLIEEKERTAIKELETKAIKIADISQGMKYLTIEGTIKTKLPLIQYTNKAGENSRMAKFILKDSTGEITILVWDLGLIDKLETFSEELDVRITKAGVRLNTYKGTTTIQLHLGKLSSIEVI